LSFKKTEEWVCRDPTPSDILYNSYTDLAVPLAYDSTGEEEQDADCVLSTVCFSDYHNEEE